MEVSSVLARPGLPAFDYVRAKTAGEVVDLLDEHGADAHLMMGGTDLLVRMRKGSARPRLVIDVKHLPGMTDIHFDDTSGLTVGAAVTMNRLARNSDVLAHYPLLAEAAKSVASYQLRNRATLGGNLCNASPGADTAPATLALEGRVVLRGSGGEREVPVEEFFLGPGRTALRPGELMTAVRLPVPPKNAEGRYLKLGRGKLADLSLVGVAVCAFPDEAVPSGYGILIALGSVGPTPFRAVEAEKVLASRSPGEEAFALTAQKAMQAANPIADVRSGVEYQKAMVRALTLRGLRDVWRRLGGS
jgi:CO/xanthine dehydrogenase FAD-binding subunit